MDRQKKIYDLMKENKLFGEIVDERENMIAIEISWGDWKHEHLRLDWMMQDNFDNIQSIHNVTTEEDGSDCYSAIHYYYFY
jgi:hypothetical protein